MENQISLEELLKMRGKVIHHFTTVEMGISVFISKFFFGTKNWNFIHTVLHNEYMTFGLKLSIFEKLLEQKGFDKKQKNQLFDKIRKLNSKRNTFAHRWAKTTTYDSEDYHLIGSKGMEDKIDIQSEYDDFFTLHQEVIEILQPLAES